MLLLIGLMLLMTLCSSFQIVLPAGASKHAAFSVPLSASRRSFVLSPLIPALLTIAPTTVIAKTALSTADSTTNSLYLILRAQEATLQELRLINKGIYKDVQRANIKLAVKFILKNYNLLGNFNNVSLNLVPPASQQEANAIAQEIISDLTTILEYFDSQDVENLKVAGGGMKGAAAMPFVIDGLTSSNRKIQSYVDLVSKETVQEVMQTINYENEQNLKEFPVDVLGPLKNPDLRLD